MKTKYLTGAALDWAVAKCEGNKGKWYVSDKEVVDFTPSTDWAQGGAIIERERISIQDCGGDQWVADDAINPLMYGHTPLIAAMRCYVAYKLGYEVDIPQELTEQQEAIK